MRSALWQDLAFLLGLVIKLLPAVGQTIPPISCPDIFEYLNYGNQYIGRITLRNVRLGFTQLNVEFSMKSSRTPDNYGSLSLWDNQKDTTNNVLYGRPVKYRVDFPFPNILPKLTSLSVNGQQLCSGQEYQGQSFTLSMENKLFTDANVITYRINGQNGERQIISETPWNQQAAQQPPRFPQTSRRPQTAQWHQRPQFESSIFQEIPSNQFQSTGEDDYYTEQPVFQRTTPPTPTRPPFRQTFRTTTPTRRPRPRPQTPPPTPPPPPPPQPERVDTQIDEAYWRRQDAQPTTGRSPRPHPFLPQIPQNVNEICGREGGDNFAYFVVGGDTLKRGEFPWLTAVFTKRHINLDFKCGGSLITDKDVITAAHCFAPGVTANQITVMLGRHNLGLFEEEGYLIREVRQLVSHENFNSGAVNSGFDIALLKLGKSVTFSKYISPICLWDERDNRKIAGLVGTVAGWGGDKNGNNVAVFPSRAKATIVEYRECLKLSESYSQFTSEYTFCAGNLDDTGPCHGDSGGGLVIKLGDNRWYLRGIVSLGQTINHKCDLQKYVAYCDVAKHTAWIRQNLS